MAEPQDYALGPDDDMYIIDGDWAVDGANATDIELILATARGSWKQTPTTGVGMQIYENAEMDAVTIDEIESKIKLQLLAAGFDVQGVGLDIADLQIVNINISADRQI